jgi:two-component system nitrogen regulation sensor histidine kinase GlnL
VEVAGERRAIACSTFSIHGRDGRRQAVAVVIQDLRALEALEVERREAERLRLMRTISAGMAHEIRNPLVAIRTFAELLPGRMDDPEFRSDFLSVAQSEISRIETLLSQLMVFSKPASLTQNPTDVNRIVGAVFKTASARATSCDITLRTELGEDLQQPLGDPERLQQAIMNLVFNALDATPAGGEVVISTSQVEAEEEDEAASLIVRVWNSGSYIPPRERSEIFLPFFTKKQNGTGLGLAICQTVVEEYGGRIHCQSEERQGTAFIVELPLSAPRERAGAPMR